MDEETKRMIIRKTWCHGQVIAPMIGIISLIYYIRYDPYSSWQYLYAGIVLPSWCYTSYRNVFIQPMKVYYMFICGLIAISAYLVIIQVTISNMNSNNTNNTNNNTWYMLTCIACSLLAFETLAFLIVIMTIQQQDHNNNPSSTFTSLDDVVIVENSNNSTTNHHNEYHHDMTIV